MTSGSLNELVSALSNAFSQPTEVDGTALSDLKRILSAFVTKNRRSDADSASRLQDELLSLFKLRVEQYPKKQGLFMTVLSHLRPAIVAENDKVEWFNLAVKPFVHQPGARRSAIEDAQNFVVGAMVYDDDAPDARERAGTCARLASILLDAYMARTTPRLTEDKDLPLQLKGQAAQYLQNMLVAFGRKKPKDLFLAIDQYLVMPDSRFQALGLLAAFVEQQQAHLYLVVHTTIVEHLLKSLMNDTATLVVSAALRCLIMLLPHIPATVAAQLPRLFLIYSRCLCWEKFSASSTKAQRDLVTDERVRRGSESEEDDYPDNFSDPTWTAMHALPDMPESSAPDLLHYFTYLYGLYPLNFMSYIRKPRKYLKTIDFPGVDEFVLDQAVIRSRTEQFQRLHLLHPSFFHTTIEDELTDNRWLKAEPSEVIAECHSLYVGENPIADTPASPPTGMLPALPPMGMLPALPPPVGKLPALPAMPLPKDIDVQPNQPESGTSSPSLARTTQSDVTLLAQEDLALSLGEDHVDQSTRRGSNATGTTVGGAPPASASTLQDAVQLQPELLLLRNELTFERYLKQQHVAAIGQLRRNHIKAVTIEAETATLINANRALQKKLGDANKFNEKMQKETQARRTHTKQSEDQLTTKIRSLKADLTNQESIQQDLQQTSKDNEQLRQLLVESEARELAKQEDLDRLQASVQETEKLRREISELSKQLRTLRQREIEFEATQTEQEMTIQELDSTKMLLMHRDQELDRSKRLFQTKILALETRLNFVEGDAADSAKHDGLEVVAELQATLEDTRSKLTQTKKAYTQLLDDYTDIKIRYQELAAAPGTIMESRTSPPMQTRDPSFTYDYRSQDSSVNSYSPVGSSRQVPHYPERGHEQVDMYASRKGYPPLPSNRSPHSPSNYPPARPARSDDYQQRVMNHNPLPRADSAAFSDNSYTRNTAAWAASNSVPSSDYARSDYGRSDYGRRSDYGGSEYERPEHGLSPPPMVLESSKSAFSFNSEDGRSSTNTTDKIKAKSEVRVYGRGGAQNIKMKEKGEKSERPEKGTKKTGMRGLKGIL